MWRKLAIALIACTGVGLIYLLSRTYFIKNNHRGIVLNYNASSEEERVEELLPGIHLLLSPFRSFECEVSTQCQILKLGTFSVKTLDNVDANVQADFTYQVVSPKKSFTEVVNFDSAVRETVKGAYSSVIQELKYQEISSRSVNELAVSAGHREDGDHEADVANAPKQEQSHGGLFFKRLINLCSQWGVEILNFRIISVEAKHQRVSEALELTAEADLKARAQATAAKAQAESIKILSEAHKSAQLIRAEAAVDAAEKLSGNPVAIDLTTQENAIRAAAELGRGGNSLVLGLGSGGFASNPATLFGERPVASRARSDVLNRQDDSVKELPVLSQAYN